MAKVIIMPKLGFTQEEGSLMGWHKKVGDTVRKGEPFFDVHTDKSVVTIDAAESGTLLKIAVENEETVPVFTPHRRGGRAGGGSRRGAEGPCDGRGAGRRRNGRF